MTDRSDDELAALGLRGSAEALEELYRRYRRPLMGFAYRLTGDRALAEDIFQSTFIYFFQHLDRYAPKGKLSAYLFRIARSKALDEKAVAVRERSALREYLYTPAPAAGTSPEEEAASQALETKVRAAMERLPVHLREVVILRLYQDLDYARIAEITGVSEATARSRMRYGLDALRKALGADLRRASGFLTDSTARDA